MFENNVLPTKLQTSRNLRCNETTGLDCTRSSYDASAANLLWGERAIIGAWRVMLSDNIILSVEAIKYCGSALATPSWEKYSVFAMYYTHHAGSSVELRGTIRQYILLSLALHWHHLLQRTLLMRDLIRAVLSNASKAAMSVAILHHISVRQAT